MATHDLDLIRRTEYRTIELNHGRIVFDSAEAPSSRHEQNRDPDREFNYGATHEPNYKPRYEPKQTPGMAPHLDRIEEYDET